MLRRRDRRLGPLTQLLVTPQTGIDGPEEFTSFSTFGLYSLSASYKRKLDFLLSFLFSSLALTLFLKHSYISFLKKIKKFKKRNRALGLQTLWHERTLLLNITQWPLELITIKTAPLTSHLASWPVNAPPPAPHFRQLPELRVVLTLLRRPASVRYVAPLSPCSAL